MKILTSLLLVAASPATAFAPPMGPEFAPPGMDRQAARDRLIDDYATILRLRPEQRAALARYLDVADAPPPPPDAVPPGSPPTFLERLADMERHSTRHSGRMAQRIEAGRAFFTMLDSQQRAAFDALERVSHGSGPMGPPPPQG